jgi:hypothetical protein
MAMSFGSSLRRIAASTWLVTAPIMSSAQVANLTDGELALTPAFCQDVQTVNGWSQFSRPSPRSGHWVSLMGPTFWGMHHYCWALVHLQRANRAGVTPQVRSWAIREAIADFYYVVKVAPRDFVLLPEIYYRTGEAYLLLEEYGTALGEFQKSRSVNPAYWPSYVSEANLLIKTGKRKEALALLESGLAVTPAEPNLLAAVKRINADRPRKSAGSP